MTLAERTARAKKAAGGLGEGAEHEGEDQGGVMGLPDRIETAEAFDRLVEEMEASDFNPNATAEERAHAETLHHLIAEYDDHVCPDEGLEAWQPWWRRRGD